ncbi:TetR/AcrR family transcriptional regulator [Methylobacillus caricis]|uniref:TetR/AcrR family transcriptional regulator n=1 Tax=Methylobacillus caricis TaxID=1971611 RepID=UPI001D00105E|nr:TetR/AcrR family transcriptional regulator [Methylobacillus caricis]MCB5186784.1 TetR/AcrR family transcriptional regulator [Methylobacillus caricis]
MTLENMRSKILKVASNLFESRGINASGVDTIIAEAGVAKATLYKHFPSKDLLIIAFLRSNADNFLEWLKFCLKEKPSDPAEKLIQLCELLEEHILNAKSKGLPFHLASVEFPDPNHPVHKYSVRLAKELQSYLVSLANEAGVVEAESLSQQIIMLFEGASLVERLSPGNGATGRAKQAASLLIRASLV